MPKADFLGNLCNLGVPRGPSSESGEGQDPPSEEVKEGLRPTHSLEVQIREGLAQLLNIVYREGLYAGPGP